MAVYMCMYVCEGADVSLVLKCLPVKKLNLYFQNLFVKIID